MDKYKKSKPKKDGQYHPCKVKRMQHPVYLAWRRDPSYWLCSDVFRWVTQEGTMFLESDIEGCYE
jgi:hypothetical protein